MKKYIFILFIFLFILCTPNVKALNGICMIDSNYSNIEQGDNITVNFYIHDINDLKIIGGYLELQYDNNIFDFIRVESLYDGFNSDISNANGLLKLRLNSDNFIGNIDSNIALVGIVFKVKDSASNGYTKITMIGEEVTYVTDIDGGSNSCLSTGNKSLEYYVYNSNNEAILSSLSISNGSLSPVFNSNITNYNVSVSSNIENISINSTCSKDGCKIEGNGNKNLNVGKNTYKIIVTSPNGRVTNAYIITVNRAQEEKREPVKEEKKKEEIVKDNNANLKTLSVSVGELDPIFLSNVTDYKVEVGSDIKKIKISGICSGIECTVKGTGNKYLEYGENDYEIEVVAEDGTNKIYNVKVIRKYDLRLTSLIIDNYKLSPKFDKDILTYKVDVDDDIERLNIITQAIDPNVIVKIKGNNSFTEGKNIVKIEVSYDETDTKTYTIIVNKSSSDKSDNNIKNKSIWDNTYVIIGGIIFGLLLVGLIILFIWHLMNRKKENN